MQFSHSIAAVVPLEVLISKRAVLGDEAAPGMPSIVGWTIPARRRSSEALAIISAIGFLRIAGVQTQKNGRAARANLPVEVWVWTPVLPLLARDIGVLAG